MRRSLERLAKALELSESGKHAAVVAYLTSYSPVEIEQSPTLALLLGSARARQGRVADGQRLIDIALTGAREHGDQAIELRALNARGAIALVTGRIGEAEEFFLEGLNAAKRQDDHIAAGRCSNNLGILEHYRGRYGPALSSYTLALAAFQQAGHQRGVVEVEHNIGITYREQQDLGRALEQAGRAVRGAREVGDLGLYASTLAIQAEVRMLAGNVKLARREIDEALAIHRDIGNAPEETEDMRIRATILAAEGHDGNAIGVLHEAIDRALQQERPRIVAAARRDLAGIFARLRRWDEATAAARAARVLYNDFGAEVEVRALDELLDRLAHRRGGVLAD